MMIEKAFLKTMVNNFVLALEKLQIRTQCNFLLFKNGGLSSGPLQYRNMQIQVSIYLNRALVVPTYVCTCMFVCVHACVG